LKECLTHMMHLLISMRRVIPTLLQVLPRWQIAQLRKTATTTVTTTRTLLTMRPPYSSTPLLGVLLRRGVAFPTAAAR